MMPAGRMISWSELASIGVRRSSTMGLGPIPVPARGMRHSGAGDVGVGWRSLRYPIRGGTLQAVAECNKAREVGSNPVVEPVMQGPEGYGGPGGQPLYCASCDPTTHVRVSLRDRRDTRPHTDHL